MFIVIDSNSRDVRPYRISDLVDDFFYVLDTSDLVIESLSRDDLISAINCLGESKFANIGEKSFKFFKKGRCLCIGVLNKENSKYITKDCLPGTSHIDVGSNFYYNPILMYRGDYICLEGWAETDKGLTKIEHNLVRVLVKGSKQFNIDKKGIVVSYVFTKSPWSEDECSIVGDLTLWFKVVLEVKEDNDEMVKYDYFVEVFLFSDGREPDYRLYSYTEKGYSYLE